jgi:hypothetical protein
MNDEPITALSKVGRKVSLRRRVLILFRVLMRRLYLLIISGEKNRPVVVSWHSTEGSYLDNVAIGDTVLNERNLIKTCSGCMS